MAGISVFSLLLLLPVLAAVLTMSLMKFAWWSLLLPLFAIAATSWVLPLGLGNAYVSWLVGSWCPDALRRPRSYVVQLTLSPRTRRGLWAMLEDADDIGALQVTDSALAYLGDSVKLTLPFTQIEQISLQNVGLRGLFVYGCIVVTVSGLPNVRVIEFAERSSWLLPRSRALTRELYQCLVAARKSALHG